MGIQHLIRAAGLVAAMSLASACSKEYTVIEELGSLSEQNCAISPKDLRYSYGVRARDESDMRDYVMTITGSDIALQTICRSFAPRVQFKINDPPFGAFVTIPVERLISLTSDKSYLAQGEK